MNNLKKNIIYQYILVSIVLVMGSVYLWWGSSVITPWISSHIFAENFISDVVFQAIEIVLQITLFATCAYWYYSKVSTYIEEETDKRVKETNQLFANIAHDLKSPMTTVIGLSRALEEGVTTLDEQNQITHIICKKSQHMNKIIDLMFQYAKMDSTSYKLHKNQINVVSLVKEFTAQMYHEFEAKDMELDIDLPDNKVMAYVDQLEFSRVVDNLISNAIFHNPNGTKIQIGLKETHENLKIWVADTGNKISEEIQSTIFEPFICEDESRNTKGGSGLGLAITKKIIEMHGGQIYIDENIEGYTKAFVIKISKN